MKFEDVEYKDEFDGVWACASLLHVPKADIKYFLKNLIRGLKNNGIFYGSFKYGHGEEIRGERLFNFYDESSLLELIIEVGRLEVIEVWTTQDVRTGREDERWISCLCRRDKSFSA
jgi:SAM-dependent methyltransferase